jgi:hypothetical protein
MDDYTDDKDGTFRIVVPPGARFRLQFDGGWGMGKRAVLRGGDDVASGASELKLTADTGIEISGVVVDEKGGLIQSADVSARLGFNESRECRTQADGRFALTGLTLSAKSPVLVQADGFATVRLAPVEAGTKDVRIVLKAGLTITGHLFGADGKPVTKKQVRAVSPQWPGDDLWRASVGNDGAFEIRNLPEGKWYVESIVPGCMRVDDVVTHGEFAAGTKDLELKLTE